MSFGIFTIWKRNYGKKNFEEFLNFKSKAVNIPLEPFRLILLFYLIERALKLMLRYFKYLTTEDKNLTHSKIRDTVYQKFFDNSKGLIAKFDALPFPFNLSVLDKSIEHGEEDLQYHKNNFPGGRHFRGIGKDHYADVIKAALFRAVSWRHHRKRNSREHKGVVSAFFFDPLWHYSESYRYRVPLADNFIRRNSFYWGLNLRWLGSIFLNLIELPLYTLSAKFMRDVWEGYKKVAYRPILQKVQMPRWESIRNAKPQKMV
ncbi:MAG: hypothetical protein DRQ10_06055 [Candidatus Hydrothermota bacterium]|nr:MAG: hypothetical protein DRQ10_06055 [Candidatus Hydrothermae bacterium]